MLFLGVAVRGTASVKSCISPLWTYVRFSTRQRNYCLETLFAVPLKRNTSFVNAVFAFYNRVFSKQGISLLVSGLCMFIR